MGSTGSFIQASCGGSVTYCAKVSYTFSGVTYVAKTCASTCNSGTYSDPNYGSATGSCCTTDNCNFSSTIASNKFLTGLSLMIATVLALFRPN
jgi:hypothetical protein